jgi:hypothetical protein
MLVALFPPSCLTGHNGLPDFISIKRLASVVAHTSTEAGLSDSISVT